MRIHLRFASWRWIPPAGAGGGYRLPTPTQPVCQMAETSAALHFFTPLFHSTFSLHFFTVSASVCQMEETSSYALYLLGSAVCQREETRRPLAIKSVTGREATCRAHTMQVCLPLFHSTFSLHFFTPLFTASAAVCQMEETSRTPIVFAQLCCLPAGKDKATISDKKLSGSLLRR